MIFRKPSLLTKLPVWAPRYSDAYKGSERVALLAKYKVDASSPWIIIEFTKAKHLMGQRYCVERRVAQSCPIDSNGKIPCYAVPLSKLETWDTVDEVKNKGDISMSGTTIGGIKARDENIKRYGESFYSRIGSAGGSAKTDKTKLKGFGTNRDLAKTAGSIGGHISKRKPKKVYTDFQEGFQVAKKAQENHIKKFLRRIGL